VNPGGHAGSDVQSQPDAVRTSASPSAQPAGSSRSASAVSTAAMTAAMSTATLPVVSIGLGVSVIPLPAESAVR
jgi:hypothetical protein